MAVSAPSLPSVNVLSLCAGVGGLELGIGLALRYLGREARGICYVEREAAAAASLAASMAAGWLHPAPVWADLFTFRGADWRGLVSVLASGDPCQDNSVAGKQAGSGGARFLAPQVCRIAAECRPGIIFRENVPGNAAEQLTAIVPPLEQLGYRVAAGIFSSSETGNSMRRERLFIMAVREGNFGHMGAGPERQCLSDFGGDGAKLDNPVCQRCGQGRGADCGHEWNQSDPTGQLAMGSTRCDELEGQQRGFHHSSGWKVKGESTALSGRTAFQLPPVIPGPTDSRWIDLLDRYPELQPAIAKEEAESLVCRGIDAMAYRIERLRATGNGVDPVAAGTAFLSIGARLGLIRHAPD